MQINILQMKPICQRKQVGMSKAEKERANKIDARITQELHEDMSRLGMSMINGGKK